MDPNVTLRDLLIALAERDYDALEALLEWLSKGGAFPDTPLLPRTQSRAYQGWTNYETWCVHLWLTNDDPSYRH